MYEHNRTLHRLTPSITSYIHTKTTIDFFSTTDYADGTDYIKADLLLLFLNTNSSNRTNLFLCPYGLLESAIHDLQFHAVLGRTDLSSGKSLLLAD